MNEERTVGLGDAVPFPFENLESRATDYLGKVRQEAEQLALQAKEELRLLKERTEAEFEAQKKQLDRTRQELLEFQRQLEHQEQALEQRSIQLEKNSFEESRQAGFKQGKEEGLQTAQVEFREKVSAESARLTEDKMRYLHPLMDGLVQELRNIRQSLLGYWHENILQIAAAIAFQTIGREPAKMKEVSSDLLREALELAVGCTILKIRMNTVDLTSYRKEIEALLQEMGLLTKVELESDSRITTGGCVVETTMGTIDQRLESRLERIISELC